MAALAHECGQKHDSEECERKGLSPHERQQGERERESEARLIAFKDIPQKSTSSN